MPATSLTAAALRHELQTRAALHAHHHQVAHQSVLPASVLFAPAPDGTHGNFFPPSYRAILTHPTWARRLAKTHTAYRRLRTQAMWPWRELDCAASSDALLMNVFCAPGVLASPSLAALLGTRPGSDACFGYKPRIPLITGRFDATEIDLALLSEVTPKLFLEAKLTETGFQTARPVLVERLRDLAEIFHLDQLPRTVAHPTGRFSWSAAEERLVEQTRGTAGHYLHYQVIRGALAAHTHNARFCVLADARRPDLHEAWFQIIAAVRLPALRPQLQLLTWQELASTLPCALQQFLADKYGIIAA